MLRLLTSMLLAALLVACGGQSSRSQTARDTHEDDEDDDSYVDEEPDDDDDDDDAGFVDATLLRGSAAEPIELGEEASIPGTGVRMRPPEGAQPMPFGAGFLAMRQRVQISVVVAEGGAEVLEAIRSGGSGSAPEPDEVEDIEVSGQTGRIGRDRVRSQSAVLERSWLLVHDGTRGLGVVATYEGERASAVRSGVEDVLRSVRWDREATLDAAAALGIVVGPVDGLEATHHSTANVVLLPPGADFPPEAGDPVVTVSPLPMQLPPEQISTLCAQLAARLVPAPASDVTLEGAVEDGELPGCERLATAQTREGDAVVTYAALLFNQGMPILLTASVGVDDLATWRPRFASAARTVRLATAAD